MGDNHYFDSGTTLSMDACAIQARERDNASIQDYQLLNYYNLNHTCPQQLTVVQDMQINYPNLKGRIGHDVAPCLIDVDSESKYSKVLTHGPEKQQLATRNFHAVPNLSKGTCAPGVESWIVQGSDTARQRECFRLTEQDFERNIPFTPCMQDFVRNMGMSIPDTHAIGESSRDVMRSSGMLNKCGYVQTGKNWLPK